MKLNGLYSSFYRMQFREESGVEIASLASLTSPSD